MVACQLLQIDDALAADALEPLAGTRHVAVGISRAGAARSVDDVVALGVTGQQRQELPWVYRRAADRLQVLNLRVGALKLLFSAELDLLGPLALLQSRADVVDAERIRLGRSLLGSLQKMTPGRFDGIPVRDQLVFER